MASRQKNYRLQYKRVTGNRGKIMQKAKSEHGIEAGQLQNAKMKWPFGIFIPILLNVLESHRNKPFAILVLLERKNSIEMHVSCLHLHKLSKIYFMVLTCSPTGLSSLQLSRTFFEMKYPT